MPDIKCKYGFYGNSDKEQNGLTSIAVWDVAHIHRYAISTSQTIWTKLVPCGIAAVIFRLVDRLFWELTIWEADATQKKSMTVTRLWYIYLHTAKIVSLTNREQIMGPGIYSCHVSMNCITVLEDKQLLFLLKIKTII